MEYLGTISYAVAAITFFGLAFLIVKHFHKSIELTLLSSAVVVSIVWATVAAYYANKIYIGSVFLEAVELARNVCWLLFLQTLLLKGSKNAKAHQLLRQFVNLTYLVFGALILLVVYYALNPLLLISEAGYQYRAISHLLLAALGIFLVEQLLRHISPDQRWAVKYFCVGLGGIFTYDFYLYADTLLLQNIDSNIWMARGFINALMVPFLAIAAIRTSELPLKFFVSHRIAFHTTTLLAGGLYLLAMGVGGYYIKYYGGSWGSFLQVIFLFGALALFFILIFSGSIRAALRVFLGKHFFQYRYDYRDEWLRITDTLSSQSESEKLYRNALTALADIVESPAGQLWLRKDYANRDQAQYDLASNWNIEEQNFKPVAWNQSLVSFLESSQWIVDLNEYRKNPEAYKNLRVPQQFEIMSEFWLIIPLMHQDKLLGFAILTHARARYALNWEVRDILKTAGRQVAGYLALLEVTIKLASASQFEAFNRLSAFIVHDLKNVVAQLTLVERNAEQHKQDPEFIDDAMSTIANATQRMNRLLAQLRSPQAANNLVTSVDLVSTLNKVVHHRSVSQPVPEFDCSLDRLEVLADQDRLLSVFEHLVQNAQQATEIDGFVRIRLYTDNTDGNKAKIDIEDSGCGMDAEFVRNKLFMPFVTTKGNAGMGIGVYEAREVIRSLGGSIDVESQAGKGTMFCLSIPLKK